MTLHPIFAQIVDAHMGATKAVTHATYRGWSISFDFPPIPMRNMDWSATSPDYDASYEGEEDGWVSSGGHVTAATLEGVKAEIDAWIDEHAEGGQ